jgi:hypothetical protein
MYDITSTVPFADPTSSLKLPFKLVVVAFVVPLRPIEAPISGSFVSASTTLPVYTGAGALALFSATLTFFFLYNNGMPYNSIGYRLAFKYPVKHFC